MRYRGSAKRAFAGSWRRKCVFTPAGTKSLQSNAASLKEHSCVRYLNYFRTIVIGQRKLAAGDPAFTRSWPPSGDQQFAGSAAPGGAAHEEKVFGCFRDS